MDKARLRTRLGRALSLLLSTKRPMRHRMWILAIGLAAALAAWFAARAVETWQFHTELRLAQRDMTAQQFNSARMRLIRLAQRWPGQGAVETLLGDCEMVKGHTEAALAAWGRVPDQAPEAPLASFSRGRLAITVGRYGLAESCLIRASRGDGGNPADARRLLADVHWITGRHDDYRSFLRSEFEHSRDPAEILRLLWSIDHEPYPIEGMRQTLEKTRSMAPDDDRVWLALADLATRSGRLEEASGLLTRCERARPNDDAVWRARLEWARAADRVDEVMRAASHLPAAGVPRERFLDLRAWLAARQDDRRAEREALEELIELEPDQSAVLERLADLATQDGDLSRLAELRRRKAASDSARLRYAVLMHERDPAPPPAELARAAQSLGRWFDARAWWKLAARRDEASRAQAETALARLPKAGPANAPSGRSLSDLLGPVTTLRSGQSRVPARLSIPAFTDDAERLGLAFIFDNGRSELRQLPETMSGGVAVLDFDGDGWLDIYGVQGGPFPPRDHPRFSDRLFRNRGDGRFEDVTSASGLSEFPGGYGLGVAVGDYDNDGRPDLFVTRWRSYALYHNIGHGRFEDVTVSAGFGGARDWPTSAAWADLDNDGDLDLYVCHYLRYDTETSAPCHRPSSSEYVYCGPRVFPAMPDHLFRNDRGRFVDVTAEAGIVDSEGRGLGVVATDLDEDGKTDLFVANDSTANYFFRNLGGFRFAEEGVASGLATSASGGYLAGMGVACGDFDADKRLDLAVTNFFGESTTLYHNHGRGLFSDRSAAAGLAAPTRLVLGFGLVAIDANNDGHLDLAQANGHVDEFGAANPYAMPAQLFLGDAAGRFIDISDRAGPPWQVPRLGRGLVAGDLDNDGRIDLLLVAENIPHALLHNRAVRENHFITLALEGTVSNRDAVGARVAVTVAGRTQVAARFGGGSYLSASDPRLHFGLGPALKVDRVEVAWPSGRRDFYEGLAAESAYRLIEGSKEPRPMAGFSSPTTQR
jgi:tetratricopeptide (TPR) repeat protein